MRDMSIESSGYSQFVPSVGSTANDLAIDDEQVNDGNVVDVELQRQWRKIFTIYSVCSEKSIQLLIAGKI